MDIKEKIYQLLLQHKIKLTDLISLHIENYLYDKNTIVVLMDNEIKVITKRTHGICYMMTITNDSHVCTELIPLLK